MSVSLLTLFLGHSFSSSPCVQLPLYLTHSQNPTSCLLGAETQRELMSSKHPLHHTEENMRTMLSLIHPSSFSVFTLTVCVTSSVCERRATRVSCCCYAGEREAVINGDRGGLVGAAPGDRFPGKRRRRSRSKRRGDVMGCKSASLLCCSSSLSSFYLRKKRQKREEVQACPVMSSKGLGENICTQIYSSGSPFAFTNKIRAAVT